MLINHNREKLINAIIYFCQNTTLCNKLKLYKLLYHLDFRHFAETGRSVTGLDYFAWPNGPVPVALEQEIDSPQPDMDEKVGFTYEMKKIKGKESPILIIDPKGEFDPNVFTKRELLLLERVAEEFSMAIASEMIHSTHLPGDPWERVYEQEGNKNKEIPYNYAVVGTNADEVLKASQEHKEMLTNYA